MLFGTALIFGALSLFIYNQREATEAEMVRVNLLPQLMEVIEENEEASTEPDTYAQPVGTPIDYLDPSAFNMTEVEIDGYAYIGYLSIPKLELELPIMADWDYTRLRIAPCRYTGSVRKEWNRYLIHLLLIIFPLEAAVHHDDYGGIVIHVPDNDRHGFFPGKLAGTVPPMAGDHLISAVRIRSDDTRNQHTVLPDAFCHFQHCIIVLYFEGMALKGVKLHKRYFYHLLHHRIGRFRLAVVHIGSPLE